MYDIYDDLGRPKWDFYFLKLAFDISQRSLDPNTKCGCIIVNDDNSILSTGYNSPPAGSLDAEIPLERPYKYSYMQHAEANAILNAAKNGTNIRNSTFIVTGEPCENCFSDILSVKAKRLVFAHNPAACLNDNGRIVKQNLLKGQNLEIVHYENMDFIFELIEKEINYIKSKLCQA